MDKYWRWLLCPLTHSQDMLYFFFSIFLSYVTTKCFPLLPVGFSSPRISCFTKVLRLCPPGTALETKAEHWVDAGPLRLSAIVPHIPTSSTAYNSFPASPPEEYVTSHLISVISSHPASITVYTAPQQLIKAAHSKYYYKQKLLHKRQFYWFKNGQNISLFCFWNSVKPTW